MAYTHIRLHLGRLKFTSPLYHRDSQDLMSGVNTRFVSDTLLYTVNMAKLLMAVTTNQRFIASSFYHYSSSSHKNLFPTGKG